VLPLTLIDYLLKLVYDLAIASEDYVSPNPGFDSPLAMYNMSVSSPS
jgi:hypothetical protein